jgi:uncharacterized protein (TIGR03083 family)
MSTTLDVETHLAGIALATDRLATWADQAGHDAPVPTCPRWRVRDLVVHLGMVHRWAAAELRGDCGHRTGDSTAEGRAAADLTGWLRDGAAGLRQTLLATPEDARAPVFLRDAPIPRRFWARRQAHETTVHAHDGLSAVLGRPLEADDTDLDPDFAVDGVDELLRGFLPRGTGRLRADRPFTIGVQATDRPAAWTVRVGPDAPVTAAGPAEDPDALITGAAAELYLGLWNRTKDLPISGRAEVAEQWRRQVRVRWS